MDVNWTRDPCHLSAVVRGPLAGSTRVRGSTTGSVSMESEKRTYTHTLTYIILDVYPNGD